MLGSTSKTKRTDLASPHRPLPSVDQESLSTICHMFSSMPRQRSTERPTTRTPQHWSPGELNTVPCRRAPKCPDPSNSVGLEGCTNLQQGRTDKSTRSRRTNPRVAPPLFSCSPPWYVSLYLRSCSVVMSQSCMNLTMMCLEKFRPISPLRSRGATYVDSTKIGQSGKMRSEASAHQRRDHCTGVEERKTSSPPLTLQMCSCRLYNDFRVSQKPAPSKSSTPVPTTPCHEEVHREPIEGGLWFSKAPVQYNVDGVTAQARPLEVFSVLELVRVMSHQDFSNIPVRLHGEGWPLILVMTVRSYFTGNFSTHGS